MVLKEKNVAPKYPRMTKTANRKKENPRNNLTGKQRWAKLSPLKLTPSHAKLTEMSVWEENFQSGQIGNI